MNDVPAFDLREKLARIDQMLADHDKSRAQVEQLHAGRRRQEQEMCYVPVLAVFTGMGAAAAFFEAGVAFVKTFGGG
jgi:hypothetical protein